MTSRWAEAEDEWENAKMSFFWWLFSMLFAGIIGFSAGGGWGEPPAPVVVEKVDTLHRPPTPDFIEAFRLQCYWVPREEESSDSIR